VIGAISSTYVVSVLMSILMTITSSCSLVYL